MWAFSGYDLVSGYPKPISSFGLPKQLKKIDAALYDKASGKTLFISGDKYYRCVQSTWWKLHLHVWLQIILIDKMMVYKMVNQYNWCFCSVMMRPENLRMRDSPSRWMSSSLAWLARWLQHSSTEVRIINLSDFSESVLHEVAQVCTETDSRYLFRRFYLRLQWTPNVWVQPEVWQVVPCAGEWLLLALHQLLDC